jgi:hypothetical protein
MCGALLILKSSKKKHANSVVFGVIGIWDPTGYDLGLVGDVSQ